MVLWLAKDLVEDAVAVVIVLLLCLLVCGCVCVGSGGLKEGIEALWGEGLFCGVLVVVNLGAWEGEGAEGEATSQGEPGLAAGWLVLCQLWCRVWWWP